MTLLFTSSDFVWGVRIDSCREKTPRFSSWSFTLRRPWKWPNHFLTYSFPTMDSPSGSLLNRPAPEIALFILPELWSFSVDDFLFKFFFFTLPMFTGVSSADIGHLLPAQGSKGKSKRYVQDFCLKTATGIFSSQPLFLTAGSDSEYYFRFLVMLLFNILIVFFFNRRHPPSSPPSKRAKGICPRNTIDRFLRGHPAQEVHPHLKRPWVIFDIMSEGKKRPSPFFDIGKVSVWLCCSKWFYIYCTESLS